MWVIDAFHHVFKNYELTAENLLNDPFYLRYVITLYEWCVMAHVCGRNNSYDRKKCVEYAPECECAVNFADFLFNGFERNIINTVDFALPDKLFDGCTFLLNCMNLVPEPRNKVIIRLSSLPGTLVMSFFRNGAYHTRIPLDETRLRAGIMLVFDDMIRRKSRDGIAVIGSVTLKEGEEFFEIDGDASDKMGIVSYLKIYSIDNHKLQGYAGRPRQKSAMKSK